MYVCLCHAVTDRQIRQAASEGACSVSELQLRFRLGTNCGKCVPAAREILDASLRPDAAAPATKPRLIVSR